MSDLFNEKEITLDKLREFFHENDFSTLPVKDPSEYTEDELELYNRVLEHINNEWESIAKTLGLTHPQDCYSKITLSVKLISSLQQICECLSKS